MQGEYASNASRYLPALTGIRALAALLVLGMHTEQNVSSGLDALLPFFARGYNGIVPETRYANSRKPPISVARRNLIFNLHGAFPRPPRNPSGLGAAGINGTQPDI